MDQFTRIASFFKKFKALLLLGGIFLTCLVSIFYLLQQYANAESYYRTAMSDIAKGQYYQAEQPITKASSYHTLPTTHQKIVNLAKQNKLWQTDFNDFQQAKVLADKHNFAEANTLLNKIQPDFPTYPEVVAEKTLIANFQFITAIASAAQRAADQTKAVADAIARTTADEAVKRAQARQAPTQTIPTPPTFQQPYIGIIPPTTYNPYAYFWAAASQDVSATGISVDMTQEQPKVPQSGYSINHSLMEFNIQGDDGTSVEFGWILSLGNSYPTLFAFPGGLINGNSCYNTCGFVQVSTTHRLGDAVAVGQIGSYKVNYENGQWNYYYNGDLVGYYPASIFKGNFTHTRHIEVYGEVATMTPNQCTQMGNGLLGTDPGAAAFSNISLLGTSSPLSLTDFGQNLPYTIGNVTPNGFSVGGSNNC